MEGFKIRLQAKLHPEVVQRNLALAGLVLVVHECLKTQIVDSVRGFYVWPGASGDRYRRQVLSLAKSPFDASCQWLANLGVLEAGDFELLDRFRTHRHELAHELASFLLDPEKEVEAELLAGASALLRKIGVFWARTEMDCNPEFDTKDIPDEEIRSGVTVMMDFLLGVMLDAE